MSLLTPGRGQEVFLFVLRDRLPCEQLENVIQHWVIGIRSSSAALGLGDRLR